MLGDSHKKSKAADTEFSDNRTSRSIHLAERYSNGILINMFLLKRHFNNVKNRTQSAVRFSSLARGFGLAPHWRHAPQGLGFDSFEQCRT